MALTITFAEGEEFWLVPEGTPASAHTKFVVTEMFEDEAFGLIGPEQQFEIGPEKAVEIYPGVMLSEGHRVLSSKVRAVFQAEPNIRIYRGSLYREKFGHADAA